MCAVAGGPKCLAVRLAEPDPLPLFFLKKKGTPSGKLHLHLHPHLIFSQRFMTAFFSDDTPLSALVAVSDG